MTICEQAQRLEDAATMLPQQLNLQVCGLPQETKANIREMRLRCGKPFAVNLSNKDVFLTNAGTLVATETADTVCITQSDIDQCFRRLCDYSVYSHQNEMISGFITVKNGHRAGLCGSAVVENGRISGVRGISSINLRVARQIFGVADVLMKQIFSNRMTGVLICGVPGSGKTTLLRDLVRQLSMRGTRVSVVDERGEIAAVYCGQAGNDLGPRCDVLDGYPKGEGILIAVRCLAPDIVVCDEIGGEQEAAALLTGINSGVSIIATVHASDRDELLRKNQVMRLVLAGAFGYIVFLNDAARPCSIREVVRADELYPKGGGNDVHCNNLYRSGAFIASAID